jgi:fructokinase
MSIAGAGLIALDILLGDAIDHDARFFAGGTCGNVLAIMSHLRWQAHAIGFVGQDLAASRILADLQDVGVNCDLLASAPGTRTPVFLQQLMTAHGHPQHTFLSQCPSCGQLLSREQQSSLPIEEFAGAVPDVLFLDRLSSSAVALARSARARGAVIMYEPSVRSDREFWPQMLPLVHLLKYSADRMAPSDFSGITISSPGLWEIETRGQRGLRYRHRPSGVQTTAWVELEAIPAARVVDTCGAGDWCTAGLLNDLARDQRLMSALEDGERMLHGLRAGQALATWACGFAGARGGMYEGKSGAIRSRASVMPSLGLCGDPQCQGSTLHR